MNVAFWRNLFDTFWWMMLGFFSPWLGRHFYLPKENCAPTRYQRIGFSNYEGPRCYQIVDVHNNFSYQFPWLYLWRYSHVMHKTISTLWWKTLFHIKFLIIKIFIKSAKNKVNTSSLVIHRVKLKNNLQKSTFSINFGGFSNFHLVFFFSWEIL
jgi:hypothetical protein